MARLDGSREQGPSPGQGAMTSYTPSAARKSATPHENADECRIETRQRKRASDELLDTHARENSVMILAVAALA